MMSLKTCLSPAPPRTSLAQNKSFIARFGSSLNAFEKVAIKRVLSCPLIAPILKNKSTHAFNDVELVAIPFSVSMSSCLKASTNFITMFVKLYFLYSGI